MTGVSEGNPRKDSDTAETGGPGRPSTPGVPGADARVAPARERLLLLIPALALALLGALHVTSPNPTASVATERSRRVLRVCADPNNLPFSNERGEGFENKVAELIARDLDADLEYTWWAQRRGFIRNTLRAELCDLVPGVPTSFELVLATRPYYRSTYVFLHRADAPFEVRSFEDSVLHRLRIGVHFIGDDYANAPPAHALGNRGIVTNVSGFSIYGDYTLPNPPALIVDAVVNGTIDLAIVWGPLAGYFARRQPVPMTIVPVSPQIDVPFLPFVYDISMGVRRDNPMLKAEVEAVLVERRAEIDAILEEYGVPRVGTRQAASRGTAPPRASTDP